MSRREVFNSGDTTIHTGGLKEFYYTKEHLKKISQDKKSVSLFLKSYKKWLEELPVRIEKKKIIQNQITTITKKYLERRKLWEKYMIRLIRKHNSRTRLYMKYILPIRNKYVSIKNYFKRKFN